MNTWIEKLNDSQVEQVHALMIQEWWCATRTLQDVKTVIEGSDLILAALDKNLEVVAFSRVLTDRVFKAVLFDVIIRADYRGTGLGEKLINMLTQHTSLSDVKSLELYCPDQISGFYKKLGFEVSESKLHRLTMKSD